jgi:hypothetical protein
LEERFFVTNETGVVVDIELSAEERQFIYERLLRRNLIRHETGLPPLDVQALYHRRVKKLEDQRFRAAIDPYLEEAYRLFPADPGITARLKQWTQVLDYCQHKVGIPKEQRRRASFPEFMEMYSNGAFPLKPKSETCKA